MNSLLNHFVGVEFLGTVPLLSFIVFLAAVLRGFTGFGFALFAVPLASLVVEPAQIVPVILGLQFASGLVSLPRDARVINRPSCSLLIISGIPCTIIGLVMLNRAPQDALQLIVGVVTVGAALAMARRPGDTARPPGNLATIGAGIASGILHGMLAMGGLPLSIYYLGGGFRPEVARASMTAMFSIFSAVLLLAGAMFDHIGMKEAIGATILFPSLIAGTLLGGWLFRRMRGHHRGIALTTLLAIGIVAMANAGMSIFHV